MRWPCRGHRGADTSSEKDERIRLVAEASHDLFAEIDPQGRFVWLSSSFEKLLGRESSELDGKTWVSSFAGEEGAPFSRAIGELLGGRADVPPFAVRDASGELRHFELSARATSVREGVGSGRILCFRDVSKRVAAEAGLLAAKKANKALLQEVYHRTRNNMQMICALLESAKVDFPGPETAIALDRVADRIYAMSLVHTKLYTSSDFAKIDLSSYIPDLAERIAEEYDDKSRIRLVLDLEPAEVAIDTAIPCGLILNELITNSYMHAFPDGRFGQVRVGLKSFLDGEIEMDVQDDGIGLPDGFDLRRSGKAGLRTVLGLGESQLYGRVDFGGGSGVSCSVTFKEIAKEGRARRNSVAKDG